MAQCAVRCVCTYYLESCEGLFGFLRVTTIAWRQVFGSLHLWKHDLKNEHGRQLSLRFGEWRTPGGYCRAKGFTRFHLDDCRAKLIYCTKMYIFISQYPVRYTAQSVLHFSSPDRPVHSDTNSASERSILEMQQLWTTTN